MEPWPGSETSSFSGRTTANSSSPLVNREASGVPIVGPPSIATSPPETILAGSRLDTPMNPATKVVEGFS